MHNDSVINILNIWKSFSSKRLFQNLTISFYEGLVSGIIGPNGSGKTTLLKLICGLVLPDKGIIEIMGHSMPKFRLKIMKRMGIVLDGPRNLYWRLSGWENFVYFGGLRGVFGKVLRVRGEALFKELDLWDAKDELTQNYSRGMQQKLAIICAIVSEPDVLILDEPTLALDKSSQETVEFWIRKMSLENGKTVILTSHQEVMIERVCHKIMTLNPGSLLKEIENSISVTKRQR